ncbi:MAG: hypothetical protein EOO02_17865 [Chitinophagaceae bacterium]|nr:MAG: hypothetical protein EOO02_17865 [Chitinophagaceae bacterium]
MRELICQGVFFTLILLRNIMVELFSWPVFARKRGDEKDTPADLAGWACGRIGVGSNDFGKTGEFVGWKF